MTGMRRTEFASLTPHSFNLQSNPPAVTIEAAHSKHRQKDVLPLHPELVIMLHSWLDGMEGDQVLFPKLAKRRTWLMVKKDLERAGNPYQTHEGIADFHAAGRHSHLTELLRNGASLPEAMGLARHSDVKMTMKYAHIGIRDQARALSGLTIPETLAAPEPAQRAALKTRSRKSVGSVPGGAGCQDTALGDTGVAEDESAQEINPGGDRGYDSEGHQLAPSGTDDAKWRRRVSTQDFANPYFPRICEVGPI